MNKEDNYRKPLSPEETGLSATIDQATGCEAAAVLWSGLMGRRHPCEGSGQRVPGKGVGKPKARSGEKLVKFKEQKGSWGEWQLDRRDNDLEDVSTGRGPG